MRIKNKPIILYNIIFPIWLLWLFPTTWIVILPLNFIIDLLVIVISMKCMKITEIKKRARAVIARTWVCGFAADFVGTALMFMITFIEFKSDSPESKWWYENMTNPVSYNPFSSVYAVLWVSLCVCVSAVIIYQLNLRYCLKRAELDIAEKKKVALCMAIVTAPYLFFLPTRLFY